MEAARGGAITLLYSAQHTDRNNAVALKQFIEQLLGEGKNR
jgi:uncharacterized protein YeaO (DUF488 family)